MPKIKTNRGAAKRIKVTGSGKFKHRRGFRNHILTKKSPKRKRHLRKDKLFGPTEKRAICRMLVL